ncbi:ABC transporter ATP-binding protein [Kiloniella laminariae]|uniref:ABC transporter ATP-binding protein n=1 Tax=Kiloniella laminariae TaxID=454162 RepID=A0ABT4LJV7_9PROT|nr:ABC transporter ATP-binding protein [Kiloniella laminariae]MCZ4280272.1 ABC transporter ATP-binding protein [Kiloniella laminariae]
MTEKLSVKGGTAARAEYLLEARNITKMFGDLAANSDVTLKISPGEIHALLGENGAGKSTLVKIIYGALQPTVGELRWLGETVNIANPAAARKLGIGMVFQHFSLFEALSVAENIALALPGDIDLGELSKKISQVSSEYGLPLEPTALVADLSVGERQRIEIVRCLLQEPRLLIMDEPTAVLTPQEADQLFLTLERLASEGCAVLYISHRLDEVKRLCHDSTILRHGKVVGTVNPQKETAASLARLMVGADVHAINSNRVSSPGASLLKLNNLSQKADGPFGVALRNIELDVRAGEVVAIAGVAGNGQSELFDAISGERLSSTAESICINERNCGLDNITLRRRHSSGFVPEERLGHGAVPGFTLSENIILTRHSDDDGLSSSGFLDRAKAIAINERITQDYDVRKGKPDPEARALSGGNLQKFVVGRELDRKPRVLVINQPTWGVDAGAAALIRQALIDLALSGSAVLVISQDLDEIFEIADRIAVISRGQLSEAFPASELSLESIGLMMAGAHEKKDSHITEKASA